MASFVKYSGVSCSDYGSQYLLEALYNANEADFALKLMTATDDRSSWNMIKIGSSMTLEAWYIKYKPNFHSWGLLLPTSLREICMVITMNYKIIYNNKN